MFNPDDYQYFCRICDTHVLKNSKHCGKCNRCTYEFDHHCAWVSADIGLLNYIDFLRMLLGVLATVLVQCGLAVYTLVEVAAQTRRQGDSGLKVGFITVEQLRILAWSSLALSIVAGCLDTYLLVFHYKLIRKNITTLKHLRRKSKKNTRS